MAEAHADQEQIDELKKWWTDNGASVVAGIVIGVVGLFGWRGWQSYQQGRAEKASTEYSELKDAVTRKDLAGAQAYAETLQNDYPGTPYAALGALQVAKLAVNAGDLDRAASALQWAHEHASEAAVRDVALLRLARVRIAQGKHQDALDLIGSTPPAGFGALAQEIRGDALAALGKTDEARLAYDQAIAQSQQDASLLKQKRADLGELSQATP